MRTGGARQSANGQATQRGQLLGERRSDQIGLADRTLPLPLSYGQERLWFLHHANPGSPEYHIPLVLRLHGHLDVLHLRTAWAQILERHEILRTRYTITGDAPAQLIDSPWVPDLPIIDLTKLSAPERDHAERTLAGQVIAAPFDLEHQWPVRARLLALAADEHVLIITSHPIACDVRSLGILLRELCLCYNAAITGQPSSLPPLPVQYADYATWQRRELAGDVLETQLEYWRTQLAGQHALQLPTDRPRPAVRDPLSEAVTFTISDDLARRVRQLARDHDTTRLGVLLTAFQALLARYTSATDISTGISVCTRSRPDLQHLIGDGLNTLVVRSRWSGDPAFHAMLASTHGNLLDALRHQAVPFAILVNDLQPDRDLSRTPLYQTEFILHDDLTAGLHLNGLTVTAEVGHNTAARVDLTLDIRDAPAGPLAAALIYASALFDHATVARMAGHYLQLLEAVATSPSTPLSSIAILSDRERTRLIGAHATAPRPATECVHEMFAAQAARTPDEVAVVAGNARLTYRALDERANQVAHRLQELGAGPDSLVGVCLYRGLDLLPGLLGVWKAGAAYVPLDPALPAGRAEFILADTRAPILITEPGLVPGFMGDRVCLDEIGSQPVTTVEQAVGLTQLAYVIYTSGSTGSPKGVMITHLGMANYLRWTATAYASYGTRGAPLFSSISFDLGIPCLFTPLITGQATCLLPDDLDIADLGAALVEAGPFSFIKLTPGHLDLLTRMLTAEQARSLAGIVIAAGDTFPVSLAARWRDLAGPDGTRVASEYGPTEITVGNSGHLITGLPGTEFIPLGDAIPNTTAYVLDAYGQLAPVGVTGELCIGGDGLARGYLNRPDLTAGKFVPDPFGLPGTRLYRSGDLARRLPDGTVDFLGRADSQVKIRGYRIELGEIEAVLRQHPRVAQTVVLARDRDAGGTFLAAYIALADGGGEPRASDLREYLAASLPDYMVPAAFVVMDAIPMTANGKLDHRALPAPGQRASATDRYVAPRGSAEERIAAVWGEVLGLNQVSADRSFFDLGGDSIRAVRLVGALRAAKFSVSIAEVLEHRTIAALGVHVAGQGSGGPAFVPIALASPDDQAVLSAGVPDAHPLSEGQKRKRSR